MSNLLQAEIEATPRDPHQNTWVWKTGFAIGNCVQFVAIGLVLDFLLFSGVEILPIVEFLMLALMILGVAQRQAWLLLVAFQLSLLVTENRDTLFRIDQLDYIYVLAALMVLAFTFQVDRVREKFSRCLADLMYSFFRTDFGTRSVDNIRPDSLATTTTLSGNEPHTKCTKWGRPITGGTSLSCGKGNRKGCSAQLLFLLHLVSGRLFASNVTLLG